jgi:hypothetical protein
MVKLTLTDEQARILAGACEFYARVKMGQFKEITWDLMLMDVADDDYCCRRDEADRLLYEARRYIYPDLIGPGHSYGIGKFKDADMAWDVYQVIRQKFGDDRMPFSYYDLPKCEHEVGDDGR